MLWNGNRQLIQHKQEFHTSENVGSEILSHNITERHFIKHLITNQIKDI